MEYPRLRPKYTVQKIEGFDQPGGPFKRVGEPMLSTDPDDIDSPFVLMPRKDPAAYEAVRLYATLCESQLAEEIHAWLMKIAMAEPVYGTQGKRNRTAIRLSMLEKDAGALRSIARQRTK